MSHRAFVRTYTRAVAAAGLVVLLSVVLCGCGQPQSTGEARPAADSTPIAGASDEKGRAELWAENCARCHNIRDPKSYSDAEWQVVMHHMRVRGNLLAEEHKAILEFLKASN